ncbi:hypothetical protein VE02_05239 [Pseudogymnoascus sp. 03VT05]|nr:hypothetical protein VE02_05239 [Pseudogymnoascus sp. 03VT05]
MAFKINSPGGPVYQSRTDFGPLKYLRSIPQLVDFGLATRLEENDDWGIWPSQPDHYRAPEVILGNGWQMPADIWNLGGEEKEAFLDLAKGMLVWHPDARQTAGELAGHPFLQPKRTGA